MAGLRASRHWARVIGPRQRDAWEPPEPSRRLPHLPLLASTFLLGGCAGLPMFGSSPPAAPGAPSEVPPGVLSGAEPALLAPNGAGGPRVGVLLPLSGPNGGLGTAMLRAAELALSSPGAPGLDARDTAGPAGAAAAARLAVQSGDTILLGPLTSADTAVVAPVARSAAIPVLAFTSDVAQARPGVWVMGVTPEQQVRRLVFALKAEGRSRVAALLPSSALGDALAAGLVRACADAGLPPPTILTHAATGDSIGAAMRQLSDLPGRRAAAMRQAPAADAAASDSLPAGAAQPPAGSRPLPGAGSPPTAATPPPLPPPPLDALLLGDTGLQLQEVIAALHESGVAAPQVRVMGPELWSAFAAKLRALAGAWYVAPDPSDRSGFVQRYRAAYGQAPKPLADIAYDAAALARNLVPSGYGTEALTRQDGFAGVDGVFTLKPDGHVQRALAIFQVQPGGGGAIVQAAPRSLSDTGS